MLKKTSWSMCWEKCFALLKTIYSRMRKKLSDKVFESLMQFIKFGIVGVSNTIVSYIIYVVVLFLLQKTSSFENIDYLIAQVTMFLLSVLWSFYWNNKYVFVIQKGQQRSFWKALLKTYISYSFTGLFLNSMLLVLWVKILGASEYIAPIINLLFSVPLNFFINKFWAFKSRDNEE